MICSWRARFSSSNHSKRLTLNVIIHPFIHWWQWLPCQVPPARQNLNYNIQTTFIHCRHSYGSKFGVKCLAQGHIDIDERSRGSKYWSSEWRTSRLDQWATVSLLMNMRWTDSESHSLPCKCMSSFVTNCKDLVLIISEWNLSPNFTYII